MVISDCTVGMGITGSFCSFEKTKDVAKRLVDSFTHVTPVYSYNAQMMNTRFGKAGDFMILSPKSQGMRASGHCRRQSVSARESCLT